MARARQDTVVPGEAEETDDEEEEEELYLSSMGTGPLPRPVGLQVPGEAEETDSEGEGEAVRLAHCHLPPLIVVRQAEAVAEEEGPVPGFGPHDGRRTSLLQQKLLESNARLGHDVRAALSRLYRTASHEIGGLSAQLGSAQGAILGVAHSIRLARGDLRAVAEQIDIITSCSLLPDIRLPPAPATPAPP
ncbi:biogenesis of lysosome-related organelles complex 1 subunit 3 [Tachyglossus aculeatus]|uniref:biogenesis of lysosome-related organelles complex 1 subunit 3 n=1 Tax=Tachyglossus aculeatus TaxID=9261 RepID=UPI0018F4F4C8|nr:biogenesis of lysosome-related organelles complex 1 subunit 3 [Tachyglossus aculeatus]